MNWKTGLYLVGALSVGGFAAILLEEPAEDEALVVPSSSSVEDPANLSSSSEQKQSWFEALEEAPRVEAPTFEASSSNSSSSSSEVAKPTLTTEPKTPKETQALEESLEIQKDSVLETSVKHQQPKVTPPKEELNENYPQLLLYSLGFGALLAWIVSTGNSQK